MYGIFNSEGCVETGFHFLNDAAAAIREDYEDDDELYPARVCPDHPDQENGFCDECDLY